jgi:hypothetical protein
VTTEVMQPHGTDTRESNPKVPPVNGTNGQMNASFLDKVVGKAKEHRVNFRSLPCNSSLSGVDVVLSKDSVRAVEKRLEFTLYGYFLGDRVAFPVVDYFVKNHWQNFGIKKMMMNANGFFFFQFADRKGMVEVLEGGPWMIRNRPLFLNIWNPASKLKKDDIKEVSVWVKLHDVPLTAYTEDGLSMIATKVGKPILLDSYTETMCCENWGRSSYARALIQISALHDFTDSIALAIPNLEDNTYNVETIKVEYEWKPPRCNACCIFGHLSSVCPKTTVQIPLPVPNNSNNVDGDGFTKVQGKKAAKKHGFQVQSQKSKLVYRPVLVRSHETPGTSSSGTVSVQHAAQISGTVPVATKPDTAPSAPRISVKKTVQTSNPFAVLADDANDTEILSDASGKNVSVEEDDDDVEEVYNETSMFFTSGTHSNVQGASTPSPMVSNG